MSYADDTQIYISLEPNNNQEAKSRLEACLSDLYNWFSANMLVCNRDKSNFIYFTSKFHNHSSPFSIPFGSSVLHPVDTVRNLGVNWDKHLSMRSNISKCCKMTSFSLNRIGSLRNYFDKLSMERLVHACISTRLDYCNALLYGLPDREINRLQRIQNAAARLISCSKKHDHIVPVLKSLHWLPVKARIEYKILLLTFKILCGCCPSYLANLISFHDSSYNLRSKSLDLLRQPRSRIKFYGDRTFSYASPLLWNPLPNFIKQSGSIDIFKRHIKTFLFNRHYQ